MKDNDPKFITFEGGEGSGKSTQSKLLYEYLISQNIKAIHTREVGGTKEAEEIRNLLVHRDLLPISELMLVMAARYEHIHKLIIPSLLDGYWVICDRFIDSTACYQSIGSGLIIEDIFAIHNQLMTYKGKIFMPNYTFFMNISPQIGLERSIRTGQTNKFEEKELRFHQLVYEKFKIIANKYPGRVKSINCQNKNQNEIHLEIVDLLKTILNQNFNLNKK